MGEGWGEVEMNGIILIILGLIIIVFSYPKISNQIMSRLYNEGFVTPKRVKPENAEIIRYAGPQISLFAIGAILIFIGIILSVY